MKRFKIGQTVYYYYSLENFAGTIVEGVISKAVKNLATNETYYTVDSYNNAFYVYSPFGHATRELTADSLYSSLKKAEKEWKEEIVYGKLVERMRNLEQLLIAINSNIAALNKKSLDLSIASHGGTKFVKATIATDDIDIEGLGSVKAEIENLKSDMSKIKKAIKPKTKKGVTETSKKVA